MRAAPTQVIVRPPARPAARGPRSTAALTLALGAAARLGAQEPRPGAGALHEALVRGNPVRDTAVVESPLPGGVATFVRWIFNLPQWLQIAAFLLGVIAALVIAWQLWTHRVAILAWLRTRPRKLQYGLAAAVGVVTLAAAGTGTASWNYMQHDNDFCVGCHVMTPAFQQFRLSEHRKLKCHDCHRQSIFASMKELYYWVAERPEDIPAHAPVPTRICSECHMKADGDSTYERIIGTAGHRVHLMSDSSALKGKVECVTCHGLEVHRFIPADSTCGQSGCHSSRQTRIQLGKMAGQTTLHCVGCHAFVGPAAENISVDSAARLLQPIQQDCLGCHEMRAQLAEFDPRHDKHNGACGACHNPHTQATPAAAFETCTTAACHANPAQDSPFHRGLHAKALADCASCHKAHTWATDGQTCLDCHQNIFDDRGGPGLGTPKPRRGTPAAGARSAHRAPHPPMAPPLPAAADTVAMRGPRPPAAGRTGAHGAVTAPMRLLRPVAFVPLGDAGVARRGTRATPRAARRLLAEPSARDVGHRTAALSTADTTADTTAGRRTGDVAGARPAGRSGVPFSHRIHKQLACTACHSNERSHGELTVRTARDCQGCHHSSERSVGCEGCHGRAELAEPVAARRAVRMSVWPAARERTSTFRHPQHRDLECSACHAATPAQQVVRGCESCHAEHHAAARNCLSCHAAATPTAVQAAHTREAHAGCTGRGCHVDQAVAALPNRRPVCLSCHQEQVDHKPGRECADCHRVSWTPRAPAAGAG